MAGNTPLDPLVEPLIKSDWDRNFVKNEAYRSWLLEKLRAIPVKPGQILVEYVRERVTEQKPKEQQQQQPAQAQQPQNAQAAPVASTSAQSNGQSAVQQAQQPSQPKPAPVQQPQSVPPQRTASVDSQQEQQAMSSYFNMDSYPGSDKPELTSSYQPQYSTQFDAARMTAAAPASVHQQSFQQAQASNPPVNWTHPAYSYSAPPPTTQTPAYIAPSAASPPSNHFNPQFMHHYDQSMMSYPSTGAIDPSLVSGHQQMAFSQPQPSTSFAGFVQPQQTYSQAVPPQQFAPSRPLAPTSAPSTSTGPAGAAPSTSASTSKQPIKLGGPSELQRWELAMPAVRDILEDERFVKSKLRAASKLARLLAEFKTEPKKQGEPAQSIWGDESDVPPAGRVMILRTLLRLGDDKLWDAWYKESDGMDAVVRWFNGAARQAKKDEKISKEDRKLIDQSLSLLLQMFLRLPFTRMALSKQHKIGARVKRIADQSKNAELKPLAKQLVDHWSTLPENATSSLSAVATQSQKKNVPSSAADATAAPAKRKPADPPASANKKPRPATTVTTVTNTIPPTASTSSSSTTGAAATKPAAVSLGSLRSFKKATPAATAGGAPVPGAKASALDPLSSILESLDKKNPILPGLALPTSMTSAVKPKVREKKTVRWVEDEKLEAIRFFETDNDGNEVTSDLVHDVKMMDEQEGVTLAMHLEQEMEEDIEWYEDIPDIVVPATDDFAAFVASKEVETPAVIAHEKHLAGVVLPTPPDAPSPGSPLHQSMSSDFAMTTTMRLSADLADDPDVQTAIARAQAAPANAAALSQIADSEQLASILSQLGPQGMAGFAAGHSNGPGTQTVLPPGVAALAEAAPAQSIVSPDQLAMLANSLDKNALGSLVQHLSGNQQPSWSNGSSFPGVGTFASQIGNEPRSPLPIEVARAWSAGATQSGASTAAAAAKNAKKKKKCKFFNAPGGCDRGNRCALMHDRGNGVDVRD